VFSVMLFLQCYKLFSLKDMGSLCISNDIDTEYGDMKVCLPYTFGPMSK